INWAEQNLAITTVGIGGISMGGDISVLAAGLDTRIKAVAAGISTPDWMRPLSFEPPGEADETAQALYDAYNPITHLDNYAHCPPISFQNGADDCQVPGDAAVRFRLALIQDYYKECKEKLAVNLYPETSHEFTEQSWDDSLAWFKRFL
ncbi:MAG: prolyl oligopeptidase family serine peptidase, partial [Lentisphaeria bacterium]|nr:prolyl oligopeptidase family serine peptidase [Lentisphaeria bacterium]